MSVTPRQLDVSGITAWAMRDSCGAVVTFCGAVRESSATRNDIVALEYETDDDLCVGRIGQVIAAARSRWPQIEGVAVHHRTGRVELGGVTVVVAVSSPHRREAFEAGQYCIDMVKATVPMWKREIWEGGSAWSPEAAPITSVSDHPA